MFNWQCDFTAANSPAPGQKPPAVEVTSSPGNGTIKDGEMDEETLRKNRELLFARGKKKPVVSWVVTWSLTSLQFL